ASGATSDATGRHQAGWTSLDPDSAAAPIDSTLHGPDFDLDCGRCHTPVGWRALRPDLEFDHAETGYQLLGAHAANECRDCHHDPVFHHVGVTCADCHDDVVHRGELGNDCARCHNEQDWRHSANMLLEHQQTRFPLLGRHALVDCEVCHRTAQKDEYVGLPLDCLQCHQRDYLTTEAPDHQLLGMPTACDECHSVAGIRWSDVTFRHPSSFPLVFGHDLGDCGRCHTAAVPVPAGDDCFSCHADDYAETTRPAHGSSGFPTDCQQCHEITRFGEVAAYNHEISGFQLQGRHLDQLCFACHFTGEYAGRSRECYSCHSLDYQLARLPDHRLNSLPTDCELCHSPADAGWSQAVVQHTPAFPLIFGHDVRDCGRCHLPAYPDPDGTNCYLCHETEYAGTSDPGHQAGGIPTDCALCHEITGFAGVESYDHVISGYTLTGQHRAQSCRACHPADVYAGLPVDCYSCHAADYENTQFPQHALAGFSTDCAECHTPQGWDVEARNKSGWPR
ncbi:MAG: cytochrome c3 family protein, partial [bacterium]